MVRFEFFTSSTGSMAQQDIIADKISQLFNWKNILVWVVCWLITKYILPNATPSPSGTDKKAVDKDGNELPVPVSDDFDWTKVEPHKYRPFRPVYAITMGIMKSSLKEWIKMENTYLEVTDERQKIIADEPKETCVAADTENTTKAVYESYDTIINYLLTRFHIYFVADGDKVTNLLKNIHMPKHAEGSGKSNKELLEIIAINTEEDINLLEFDPEQDEYVLRAYTGVGANGFVNSEKFGKKLTDIHQPVPQYRERLQFSMNKFFKKAEPGKYMKRLTWGIQVGGKGLFRPSGNHMSANQNTVQLKASELDFENDVFLRVEQQILTKLPKSGFILFNMRTYFYPLADVKREGLGNELVKAFESWPATTAQYKSVPKWGQAVKEYLVD